MEQTSPNYPLLAIDTASSRTWVGLKTEPGSLVEQASEDDPSRALFPLVESLLEETSLSLASLASIVFCEGPGSMLGARTAVMSLRSWKGIDISAANSVFAYHSLAMGKLLLEKKNLLSTPALIVTDARRDSWHALDSTETDTRSASISLLPTSELEADPRPAHTFPQFIRWTQTSKPFVEHDYHPAPVFADESFLSIVHPTDQPTPLVLRASDFKKWTPRFHSAPNQ